MMHSSDTFAAPLIQVDETVSTNSYLSRLCAHQPVEPFTTVVANFQTGGRGQRGNSWESLRGQNLLFSVVLFPQFIEASKQFLLSQITSLAIKEVLDRYTTDISIKWPNDIYWREKKICGILIENELTGNCISQTIAGIGINVNQQHFESLAPNPVSLYQITGEEHHLLPLLSQVIEQLKEYYQMLQHHQAQYVGARYHKALFRREGMHPYSDAGGEFLAQTVCVEPQGRLVLLDDGGTERKYLFKEVQYLPDLKV